MIIDNAIIHFEPNQPNRKDVAIENTGDSILYVQVTPYRIENPGKSAERKLTVKNPKELGLLVSPNKLAIPPGGRKLVRFVNLQKGLQQEAVYRVEMKPVTGKLIARQSGLKILIGYEVLVLTQPDQPDAQLSHQLVNKKLTVTNLGNTNVLLTQGKQCSPHSSDPSSCRQVSDKRIYSNSQWTFELSENWPVQFQVAQGNKNYLHTFD